MAPSNAARRKQAVHPFYGPGAQQLRLCFAQWGTCYSQLSLKDLFSVIFLLNDTIQADLANFSTMIHSLQTKKRFQRQAAFMMVVLTWKSLLTLLMCSVACI